MRQALKDAQAVEAWYKEQAKLKATEDQIVGNRSEETPRWFRQKIAEGMGVPVRFLYPLEERKT